MEIKRSRLVKLETSLNWGSRKLMQISKKQGKHGHFLSNRKLNRKKLNKIKAKNEGVNPLKTIEESQTMDLPCLLRNCGVLHYWNVKQLQTEEPDTHWHYTSYTEG